MLGALLNASTEDWYGLELAKAANLSSGTIYPALARLERMGWVESFWEDVDPSEIGRPRRRLYRLTGQGERSAIAAIEELAKELERARAGYAQPRLTPRGQPA